MSHAHQGQLGSRRRTGGSEIGLEGAQERLQRRVGRQRRRRGGGSRGGSRGSSSVGTGRTGSPGLRGGGGPARHRGCTPSAVRGPCPRPLARRVHPEGVLRRGERKPPEPAAGRGAPSRHFRLFSWQRLGRPVSAALCVTPRYQRVRMLRVWRRDAYAMAACRLRGSAGAADRAWACAKVAVNFDMAPNTHTTHAHKSEGAGASRARAGASRLGQAMMCCAPEPQNRSAGQQGAAAGTRGCSIAQLAPKHNARGATAAARLSRACSHAPCRLPDAPSLPVRTVIVSAHTV